MRAQSEFWGIGLADKECALLANARDMQAIFSWPHAGKGSRAIARF